MEDLWFNSAASFTSDLISSNLLLEPFVLIDVGVQGGSNARWDLLQDYLILHGFDAIEEVIDHLKKANRRPNRHFHSSAIGNTDGECTFYYNAATPFASSMHSQGDTRFERALSEQARTVKVRRLDTLLAEGAIPPADFLKVDVEGYEKEVFQGGLSFMSAGVLGVEVETNFNCSPQYPKSHFSAISDILVEQGLMVFDLGYNRIPRASFLRSLRGAGIGDIADYDLGRPATFNFLFCRDLIQERDLPQSYVNLPPAPSIDQIVKMMIIYELYGLNDVALDTAERFSPILAPQIDVERAMRLLANVRCRPLIDQHSPMLAAMRRSTSWRITAPLRALKLVLSGRWNQLGKP